MYFGANLIDKLLGKNKRNKGFLPPIEEYQAYVEQYGVTVGFTNDGPLLLELEKKLRARLENERSIVEMEP
jgi:hypothetical protein